MQNSPQAGKLCPSCGNMIEANARKCRYCGEWISEITPEPKSHTVTLLLAFFFGWLGAHRFYTGYIVIGIVQMLTLGCYGLWGFIDLICIALNKYKDKDGRPLQGYNKILSIVLIILCLGFWMLVFISGGSSDIETTSPDTANTPVEQIQQPAPEPVPEPETEQPANETHNGIAFNVLSKKIVTEADLRSAGLPASGNSLVLLVNINVKNNGKKPYKPDVQAQLIDENEAVYAGMVYKNVFMDFMNSSQNILNPGMEKAETFYFKIPENKNYTIQLQDGTFFSDTVSIKL